VDRLVEAWSARDRANAFMGVDVAIIESTAAARAFAAERLLRTALEPDGRSDAGEGPRTEVDRDLLHAFGVLGRIVGERGGSPTLAATTVDSARQALDAIVPRAAEICVPRIEGAWVMPARAALVESFVAALQRTSRAEATTRWEYPRCVVGLHDASIAIAAGFPEDDAEALAAWAERVAHDAALAGVRRAVVSGSRAAQAALAEALEVVGIERLPACAIGGGQERGRDVPS
jgi:hypothetical protein